MTKAILKLPYFHLRNVDDSGHFFLSFQFNDRNTTHYSRILINQNILFLRNIHTKSWYGHAGVLGDLILCGFRCAFSCMFQYSLCHGMDIGTCDIVHGSAAPHNRIGNRTGFSVYVVLALNVIRYSCQYFLDIILFHHDFHHDSCEYHWNLYGH